MRGIIIRTDGKAIACNATTLKEMQAAVGGDIEVITLDNCEIYCNENGFAEGLLPNPVATAFANERLRPAGRELITVDGYIVGDVLLLGMVDDEGGATDLPPEITPESISAACAGEQERP